MKKCYLLYVLAIACFFISFFTSGILKIVLEAITAFLLLEEMIEKSYQKLSNRKLSFDSLRILIALFFFLFQKEQLFLFYEFLEKIRILFLKKAFPYTETEQRKNNQQNIIYLKKRQKMIFFFSFLIFLFFLLLLKKGNEQFLFLLAVPLLFRKGEISNLISSFYKASFKKVQEREIIYHKNDFFEKLNQCDEIVLSKTGVVTYGKMELAKIIPVYQTKEEILKYASILEKNIIHPMAAAINVKYQSKEEFDVSLIHEIKGKGIRGIIDGHEVILGNGILFEDFNIKYPRVEFLHPTSMIAIDGTYVGTFVFKDELKSDLEFLFPLLKEEGIQKSILVSSSSKEQVKKLATHLSILESYANLTLEDKISLLKNEKRFHHILYVDNHFESKELIKISDLSISMESNKNCDLEFLDGNLTHLLFLKKEAKRLKQIENRIFITYAFFLLINLIFLFISYKSLPYISFLLLILDFVFYFSLKKHQKSS